MSYRCEIERWEHREIQRAAELAGDPPESCPTCKGPLNEGSGMVGETVLYCPKGHGIAWEDMGDAVRRVI